MVFNDCEKKPFIFFGIVDFQTDVVLAVRIQQDVVQPFKGKVPVAAGNLQPVFSLNVQMQVNVAEIAVIVMFLGGKHVHPSVELVNVYPFQYAVKAAGTFFAIDEQFLIIKEIRSRHYNPGQFMNVLHCLLHFLLPCSKTV